MHGDGLSEGEARRLALRTVAEPGTSEHETGLAIDVTSESQTYEDNAAVWDWMSPLCRRSRSSRDA